MTNSFSSIPDNNHFAKTNDLIYNINAGMKNIKVSIVIPAYNEELFLPKLLKSVNKQSFKLPYEVIVVNNNSTDKTAQVAKKYGAKVVFEKRRGYAYSCNKGFYSAKGEIIARADADYVLPKDWLEKIWDKFSKDKSLIALGGPVYPLESRWWENFFYYPASLYWMYVLKLIKQGYLFPNMAVRRSVFLQIGGFDPKVEFGEDMDICRRLSQVGKVKLIPSLYIYTSLRRLRSLGIYNMITRYALGNIYAIARGKKVTFGLNPIRIVPLETPSTPNPLPYLITVPTLIVIITISSAYLFIDYSDAKQESSLSKMAQKELDKLLTVKSNLENFSQKIQTTPAIFKEWFNNSLQ